MWANNIRPIYDGDCCETAATRLILLKICRSSSWVDVDLPDLIWAGHSCATGLENREWMDQCSRWPFWPPLFVEREKREERERERESSLPGATQTAANNMHLVQWLLIGNQPPPLPPISKWLYPWCWDDMLQARAQKTCMECYLQNNSLFKRISSDYACRYVSQYHQVFSFPLFEMFFLCCLLPKDSTETCCCWRWLVAGCCFLLDDQSIDCKQIRHDQILTRRRNTNSKIFPCSCVSCTESCFSSLVVLVSVVTMQYFDSRYLMHHLILSTIPL